MGNKKVWLGILVMLLVFGMSVLTTSCSQKGGTVIFTNDIAVDVTVAIGVGVNTNFTITAEIVEPGKSISKSISENGFYTISVDFTSGTTTQIISKSGTLTGGETITLKASDF